MKYSTSLSCLTLRSTLVPARTNIYVLLSGKEQLLNQNILHYSATSYFLEQLLSSLFQWQKYCCPITGHLCALYRDTSAHDSLLKIVVDIRFVPRHLKKDTVVVQT